MQQDYLQDIVSLRSSGQYVKALSTLAATKYNAVQEDRATQRWLLIEQLICCVLIHDFQGFEEVTGQVGRLEAPWPELEDDLCQLLHAYAGFHTAIDLKTLVDISARIFEVHLQGLTEFRTIHSVLLCFSAIGMDLGKMFFGLDNIACVEKLEEVWQYLLEQQKYNDLAMILLAEAECLHPHQRIYHLETAIQACGNSNLDLAVHLKVLLLNGDRMTQVLSDLRKVPFVEHNQERQLWADLSATRFKVENGEVDINPLIPNKIADFKCNHAFQQALGFLQASWNLQHGIEDQYMSRVLNLLEHSHSSKVPQISGNDSGIMYASPVSNSSQSSWLFWRWYMNILPADLRSSHRRGLAVQCVQTFFKVQTKCSIPELRFSLSTVLAEYYEEIGDVSQTFRWRALGMDIARHIDDQEAKDEAECNLRLALTDEAYVVLNDPHGIQQKRWNTAKMRDLEELYNDTKKRGNWEIAFRYARRLFDMELRMIDYQELLQKNQKWYLNTMEALRHFPEAHQLKYSLAISSSLAQTKFDHGDYEHCIEDLAEIIKSSGKIEDYGTKRMALFTSARARLHQYQQNGHDSLWTSGVAQVDDCLTLCTVQQAPDWIACCHVLKANFWYTRQEKDNTALEQALYHLHQAREYWTKDMNNLFGTLDLNKLLSKYSKSGTNARTPYPVFDMAVDICIAIGDTQQAWSWVEYSKARALLDSLENQEAISELLDTNAKDKPLEHLWTTEPIVLVHWIFLGERIMLFTSESRENCTFWELNCSRSELEEWYNNFVTSQEDLSDPETSQEILAELQELVRPLIELARTRGDCVFLLCPTQIIFKIPVHAVPVDGNCLLDLVPVVYTHSFDVLERMLRRQSIESSAGGSSFEFFGSPTGDTPAGSDAVKRIVEHCGGQLHIDDVSRKEFLDNAVNSSWLHYHGHVMTKDYALNQALLFHHGEEVSAREVFRIDLSQKRPVVLLIGCGSAVEKLSPGDEPLGLVSSLIFAGASSVIATLWPIHDSLSGAKFGEHFYGLDSPGVLNFEDSINLARRLRSAALNIKADPATQAPYFWAAFVLYGCWNSRKTSKSVPKPENAQSL